MMKFQVLLLAFALVIANNIHCQAEETHTGLEQLEAQPQLEDSDKSPVVKGHVMSRQVRTCNCSGRRIAMEQNCPCELQRQYRTLSKEQKALCQKKGIMKYKKCQQLTGENRKEKKVNKGISNPI